MSGPVVTKGGLPRTRNGVPVVAVDGAAPCCCGPLVCCSCASVESTSLVLSQHHRAEYFRNGGVFSDQFAYEIEFEFDFGGNLANRVFNWATQGGNPFGPTFNIFWSNDGVYCPIGFSITNMQFIPWSELSGFGDHAITLHANDPTYGLGSDSPGPLLGVDDLVAWSRFTVRCDPDGPENGSRVLSSAIGLYRKTGSRSIEVLPANVVTGPYEFPQPTVLFRIDDDGTTINSVEVDPGSPFGGPEDVALTNFASLLNCSATMSAFLQEGAELEIDVSQATQPYENAIRRVLVSEWTFAASAAGLSETDEETGNCPSIPEVCEQPQVTITDSVFIDQAKTRNHQRGSSPLHGSWDVSNYGGEPDSLFASATWMFDVGTNTVSGTDWLSGGFDFSAVSAEIQDILDRSPVVNYARVRLYNISRDFAMDGLPVNEDLWLEELHLTTRWNATPDGPSPFLSPYIGGAQSGNMSPGGGSTFYIPQGGPGVNEKTIVVDGGDWGWDAAQWTEALEAMIDGLFGVQFHLESDAAGSTSAPGEALLCYIDSAELEFEVETSDGQRFEFGSGGGAPGSPAGGWVQRRGGCAGCGDQGLDEI